MRKFQQIFSIIGVSLISCLLGFLAGVAWITTQLWRQRDEAFIRQVAKFNKRWTNPAIRPLAGRPKSPYALVEHTGRRSGHQYTTPVLITSTADGFIIPLLYGENSDWHRNLVAMEHGIVTWQGKSYAIGKPEMVTADQALQAFPPLTRQSLQSYGIDHFIKVSKVSQIERPPTTRPTGAGPSVTVPTYEG